MERRVKERLVGAAVLMAAAIILNEAMLSDPRRDSSPGTSPASADSPLKTYTIDLNRSPGTQATPHIVERAPPPEEPASAGPEPAVAAPIAPSENTTPAPQADPERSSSSAQPQQRVVQDAQPRSTNIPQATAPARTALPAARDLSASQPIASAPSAPTSRGWAVQLGSFANRATADRMVKDLSLQGQSAFVMPVRSSSSTLYRVRIGPFSDRAAADQTLREVKGSIANAAVVAHP